MKIVHFADAHIDMVNFGRHDPHTGLPLRVLDFLRSLDEIVETAITEKADLVIFAGDAYKDRTPAPTFQREWGRRVMRLSQAGITTILLVGNHDLSPSSGRAHAVQEFDTLQVPHVHVIARPTRLGPAQLGLPVQVIGLPWVSRSGLMAALEPDESSLAEIHSAIETRLGAVLSDLIAEADPDLPLILTAHASVQGATFGVERQIMLGADLALPAAAVKDPRLDYVALGHIHKPQDLNEGRHPPVIYPGSIERVDFSEAGDDKFFIVAEVRRGAAEVSWRKLEHVRPFIDCYVRIDSQENVTRQLIAALPPPERIAGAVVRLRVDYPRDFEKLIDQAALREHTAAAFEFHFRPNPLVEGRVRLPVDRSIASMTPVDLLGVHWQSQNMEAAEIEACQQLAAQLLGDDGSPAGG